MKPTNQIPKIILSLCIALANLAPIVHAQDLNAPDSATVANELNALYNKTEGCSGNDPDYYCSGVIVHADDFSYPEPWFLPAYRDVGSFSYLRSDIISHTGSPIFDGVSTFTGYVLTSTNELITAHQYPYEVYCSYPENGGTDGREVHGCGKPMLMSMMGKNIDYSTCAGEKVFSIDDFMKKYSTQDTATVDGHEVKFDYIDSSCSFSSDKIGFKLSMDISKYLFRDNPAIGCDADLKFGNIEECMSHNELIVSAWTKETTDVSQVPIKAFFAVIHANDFTADDDLKAIRSAFKTAADYATATHQSRQIPVVIVDMKKIKDGSPDVFSAAVEPGKN